MNTKISKYFVDISLARFRSVCNTISTTGLISNSIRSVRQTTVFLVLSLTVLCFPAAHAASGNEYWSSEFSLPGINGRVFDSIEDNAGNLYIRGGFTSVAGIRANQIAMWDGTSWTAPGEGLDGDIIDMALDSQGNLYVVYEPNQAGVGAVARRDGNVWTSLDPETEAQSDFYNIMIDVNDKLYAGGDFITANGNHFFAATWDGSNWNALGVGLSAPVDSMVINNSGELLALTGSYSDFSRVIRKLSGNTWVDFDDPVQGRIGTMITGPDGALYVAGQVFSTNFGTHYTGVARWSEESIVCISDGVTGGCSDGWTHLGSGVPGWGPFGGVHDLAFDQSGTLYAGGLLQSPIESNQQIMQWDGNEWSELTYGTAGFSVDTITTLLSGKVLLGGDFGLVDSPDKLKNLALWDGSDWSGFDATNNLSAKGLDGEVTDMVADGVGNVYVTGGFTQAGSIAANHIAHWDGQRWNALGDGLPDAAKALALGGNGNLYAASEQQGVWVWSGESWSTINTGLGEILLITDTAISQDGTLYMGGIFAVSGGRSKGQVARWDGTSWVSFINEIRVDNTVLANEVRPTHMAFDANGSLYVSGPLIDPTGPFPPTGGIVEFDGNQLELLDSAPDFNSVGAITLAPDDSLYTVATTQSADGTLANAIWHWDGNVWSLIVDIPDTSRVNTLAVSENGDLFAGLEYGNGSVVLWWDGTSWVDMGTGIENGRVNALAFATPDTLFVGGSFDTAGGMLSNNIASFTIPVTNAVCNGLPVTVYLSDGDTPTSRPDVILGTSGDDTIVAMGGDDTICGLGGNDIIIAGNGNDWVDAGAGNDTVEGGNGSDEIYGDSGVDILNGGPHDDEVYGEADGDFINGNSGNDVLDGGLGIDQLRGGSGNDTINTGPGGNQGTGLVVTGGAGNDVITGGPDADEIRGESGNDTINGGDASDSLFGGGGNDIVNGQDGNDILRGNGGKDAVIGGDGNDDMDGGASDDILSGGEGNDVMRGATGNDEMSGGAGDDEMYGGGGNDVLTGNRGDDELFGGGSNDTLNGGSDTDSCSGDGGTDSALSCESQTNIP